MSEPPGQTALTLKRQGGAGDLIAALEHAWHAIQLQHPDLPGAHVVVARGSGRGRGVLLGHLAPDRWRHTGRPDTLMHELMVAGEGLADGADEVFGTLLHEAAHALAVARGVADTSRDGRYHNHAFKTLAEQLGLIVTRDPTLGWSHTDVSEHARARYAAQIAAIAAAITAHRLPEPAAPAGRNLTAAVCACTVARRIRVAPRTLAAGAITCGVCGAPFSVTSATAALGGGERAS